MKKPEIGLIVTLLTVSLCLAGDPADGRSSFLQGSNRPTPEENARLASEAIKKKDYKAAEKKLKQAISAKPDLAEAHLLLGVVYRFKAKPNDALKHVNEAIRLRPEYADAHCILGLLHYDKGDKGSAYREILTGVSQGARYPNIYIMKAQLELFRREYELALVSYEEALKLSQAEEAARIKSYVDALRSYLEFKKTTSQMIIGDPNNKRPIPLNRPRPNYTEKARQVGIQGVIRAVVRVEETGKPGAVLVLSGLGYGLDQAAEKAVKQMRFSPAIIDGKPAAFWIPVEVEFQLR